MPVRSFYRVAKTFPPGDDEYLTPREPGRKPRANASAEEVRSLDGLISLDSEDGARRVAQQFPKVGSLIVRYDLPDGAGIIAEQTITAGHYDLYGDKEELKR
jgi:hypothetical protein